jgi:hypothetical protein
MVEQALSGRSHLNFQASFNTIIKPAGSVSVVEAVDSINPESGDVQVKNYQENELTGAVQ